MAYESGALFSNIAAAVGEDPALVAELRAAFLESALRQLDLLRRSRCDGNWRIAALRLKAIAASFQVDTLAELADEAFEGAPGDPVVLSQIARRIADLSGSHPD